MTELSHFENKRSLDLICMGRVAVDLYAEQVHSPLEDAQSWWSRKKSEASTAGISIVWAGCDPEEKYNYAVIEVSDPETAMAFGKREDVAAIRAEAGVLVETTTSLSAIAKSFIPE